MRIYTRTGDDGTTGRYFGGRVRKDDPAIELNGSVDEAQASIGVARAATGRGGDLDVLLLTVGRDLWVLMSEVATAPENRRKLVAGKSLVTEEMVERLERAIDERADRIEPLTEFVVPGDDALAAALDVARTVVRRAERQAVRASLAGDSLVARYLNRLSDLLWIAARVEEGQLHRTAKGLEEEW
jgi:cob(I)alamin adenosyltransferase